ncbi:MAG: YXWGXW repeat-containing protein [Planctomycetaceae bacterium]|nr:YXWGXW repeat-containing protein [Planctomycetaceae bacterium]
MFTNRTLLSALAGAGLVATLAGVGFGQAQPGGPALNPPAASDPALPDAAPDDKDPNLPEGAEVYTRGPLHEAFAKPVTNDPAESPVISKKPPEAVDEIPPDEKPEGNNVVWIPGYWAWDEELDDFLWVSGLWRDAPPGRRWVPGYWTDVDDGYRWIQGAWVNAEAEQLTYLPQPPASLETGPSSEAPSEQHIWVPGYWDYGTSYNWRPGYWTPYQEDWIWVPPHYHYTPSGFLFVPGYWDYQFVDRGLAFAPVYFSRPWAGPYYPAVVVNTWSNFFVNLFVSPRTGWYVYGNYYNPVWSRAGVVPWDSVHGGRRGYDPIFAHYHHRHGDVFTNRLRGWHNHYVNNVNDRPPVTWSRQRDFLRSRPNDAAVRQAALATSLRRVTRDNDQPFRFAHLSREQQSAAREHARDLRTFQRERVDFEKQGIAAGGRRDNDNRPQRSLKLPNDPRFQRSATVSRSNETPVPGGRPGANIPGRNDNQPGAPGNRPGRGNEVGRTPNLDPRPGRDNDPPGTRPGRGPGRDNRDNPGRDNRDNSVAGPGRGDNPRNDAANTPRPGRPTIPGARPMPNADDEKTTNTPRPNIPSRTPGIGTNRPGERPTIRGQSPETPRSPLPGTTPGTGTRPGTGTPGVNPGTTPGTRPGAGTPGTTPGTRPGGNIPGLRPGSNPGSNPGVVPGGGNRPGAGVTPSLPRSNPPAAGGGVPNIPRTQTPSIPQQPRVPSATPSIPQQPRVPSATPSIPQQPRVPSATPNIPRSSPGAIPGGGGGRAPGAGGQPRTQFTPSVQPRSFSQPQQSFSQPQQSFSQPQRSFSQPQRSFTQPQRSFSQPQRSFTHPQRSFSQPRMATPQPRAPQIQAPQIRSQPQARPQGPAGRGGPQGNRGRGR